MEPNKENQNKKEGISKQQVILIILIGLFTFYLFSVYQDHNKPRTTLTDTELDQLYEKMQKETAEQVKKIHNTKITMADVLGTNLPSRPSDPDATVQGYDVNNNGIRDDVELDIFQTYPNSQKTRAVLLQYALTQHMRMTQPIANEGIVNAVSSENSRAYACVSNIFSFKELSSFSKEGHKKAWDFIDELREFIQKRQNNTPAREEAVDYLYEGNFTGGKDLGSQCDINLTKLPN